MTIITWECIEVDVSGRIILLTASRSIPVRNLTFAVWVVHHSSQWAILYIEKPICFGYRATGKKSEILSPKISLFLPKSPTWFPPLHRRNHLSRDEARMHLCSCCLRRNEASSLLSCRDCSREVAHAVILSVLRPRLIWDIFCLILHARANIFSKKSDNYNMGVHWSRCVG